MDYINATDKELGELCGESRQQFTRWRTGQRSPSFEKVLIVEDKTGFPFECFISREPNLDAIKEKLEIQLIAVNKAIKEREEIL